MNLRHLGRTVTTGVVSAVLFAAIILFQNSGVGLRAENEASPANVPGFAFVLLGGLAFLAVVVSFGRGSAMHERWKRDRVEPTFRLVLDEYSLPDLLVIGPIQAAFLTLAALICRILALDSGTPGTLWSELASNPAAVAALFGTAWAATNLGIAFAGLAMRLSRSVLLSLLSLVVFIGLLIGVGFAFRELAAMGVHTVFIIAVIAVPVTLLLVIGSRSLALSSD